ncbi:TPA: Fur-regulated basic protein FbpA [Bacillus anthracis]|nr:Fur-regulated basic protein FbpA [Bacillus cereus biovar anthracis]HDR6237715.1 Fur-regulated basic protein FbpA [Bacillus cereus biovar anthracis]HDR6248875.1 Fur-regulated basic protein FbpA [Bacillus cereus biovar anthracis]
MDKKQIYIDVLLHKGIYKEKDTGRQLYEMDEIELWKLLKGDEKNGSNRKQCL